MKFPSPTMCALPAGRGQGHGSFWRESGERSSTEILPFTQKFTNTGRQTGGMAKWDSEERSFSTICIPRGSREKRGSPALRGSRFSLPVSHAMRQSLGHRLHVTRTTRIILYWMGVEVGWCAALMLWTNSYVLRGLRVSALLLTVYD